MEARKEELGIRNIKTFIYDDFAKAADFYVRQEYDEFFRSLDFPGVVEPSYVIKLSNEELSTALKIDQLYDLAKITKIPKEELYKIRSSLTELIHAQAKKSQLPPLTPEATQGIINGLIFIMRRLPELPVLKEENPNSSVKHSEFAEERITALLTQLARRISGIRPQDRANVGWEWITELMKALRVFAERDQIDFNTFIEAVDGMTVNKSHVDLLVWGRKGIRIQFPKKFKQFHERR